MGYVCSGGGQYAPWQCSGCSGSPVVGVDVGEGEGSPQYPSSQYVVGTISGMQSSFSPQPGGVVRGRWRAVLAGAVAVGGRGGVRRVAAVVVVVVVLADVGVRRLDLGRVRLRDRGDGDGERQCGHLVATVLAQRDSRGEAGRQVGRRRRWRLAAVGAAVLGPRVGALAEPVIADGGVFRGVAGRRGDRRRGGPGCVGHVPGVIVIPAWLVAQRRRQRGKGSEQEREREGTHSDAPVNERLE
ncbi:hypothetical protein BZA05DRAFT_212547 [Tricharina praecox]|uniref:uncharacterized protein n=1 Tax=Tricharina praecox TaxID=43433 RepID=UPI00221E6B03|nr:uncharacterized protein BZA05DRAFT_212547 [Tricharina praecox]KAI5841592.1 hypothetical protein BZA05DRAFT_212547 [Tricharina praecox]